ncbi:MAG: acetyl-CoA C-acyltransferase, partial [Gammaproteobacteria bacterium]|nr:acetyl-CoA C-acyltransferase [Gammaproteobacteria bacterium]
SLVQNEHMNHYKEKEDWLMEHKPDLWIPMIDTADIVSQRYGVSRDVQDAYALQSQQRTAAGQEAGRFDDEIVPITTIKLVQDKETKEISEQEVTLSKDEGNRPTTTLEGLSGLKPVMGEDKFVTAGNASQQNDAAAACLVVAEDKLEELGLEPMGFLTGWAAAGCEPSRMGIGPVPAVERLFGRTGLSWDDIDLVELNEAFAPQVLAVLKGWGWDDRDKLNVNGSGISLGHPIGATGGRILANLMHELKRRDARYGLETMCIGGGQGLAAIFESVS